MEEGAEGACLVPGRGELLWRGGPVEEGAEGACMVPGRGGSGLLWPASGVQGAATELLLGVEGGFWVGGGPGCAVELLGGLLLSSAMRSLTRPSMRTSTCVCE